MKKVDAISYVLLAIAMIIMVIFIVYKVISSNVVAPISSYVIPKRMNISNMTYMINGESLNLINGMASREIVASSGARQIVRLFGNPAYGDLNGDENKKDAALVLTSRKGDEGTEYYAVFAIATGTMYKASDALFLGEGIVVKSVKLYDGDALYTYTQPSVSDTATSSSTLKNVLVHYNDKDGKLGELAKDFEGEADASTMTLSMKKWEWVKTELNDGTKVEPKKEGAFSVIFNKNGAAEIKTDCNAIIGKYERNGSSLVLSEMASTLMYCEGSQEGVFGEELGNVSSFFFTGKGGLVLEMKRDSGVMIFK